MRTSSRAALRTCVPSRLTSPWVMAWSWSSLRKATAAGWSGAFGSTTGCTARRVILRVICSPRGRCLTPSGSQRNDLARTRRDSHRSSRALASALAAPTFPSASVDRHRDARVHRRERMVFRVTRLPIFPGSPYGHTGGGLSAHGWPPCSRVSSPNDVFPPTVPCPVEVSSPPRRGAGEKGRAA